MEPEELKKLIEKDRQRRLNEFDKILQEASTRLGIELKAKIETSPSGESAIAQLTSRAL